MKHNAQMYTFLKQRDKLFEGLMACLRDEDQNVRKVSGQSWINPACNYLSHALAKGDLMYVLDASYQGHHMIGHSS